jgi:hypothetical protein
VYNSLVYESLIFHVWFKQSFIINASEHGKS